MALKNWIKEFESKKSTHLVRWRNVINSDNIELHYTKYNETNGYAWFVDVITYKAIKSTEFKTKLQALRYATAFMRKN